MHGGRSRWHNGTTPRNLSARRTQSKASLWRVRQRNRNFSSSWLTSQKQIKMATIRYVPSRSAHARELTTHSKTLDNRRIFVAPTEPKCGNKKCWLRRLRIGQKCGSARTFPRMTETDGRPLTVRVLTKSMQGKKGECYSSQECMCLLLGWFPRGVTLLVPRSTALSSLLPHGRECLAMRAPQLLAHILRYR